MWFFILIGIVAVGFIAWKMRVQIAAKVLGQSESRVRRHLK